MFHRDIIISSTDNLEGYKIVEYHDMISVRQTNGVDFVAEFFTGFSDFLGGRSVVFEKALEVLYEGAIVELKKKAHTIPGVNAIVGTHVDIDELSGKNTMMLMITVCGTPVRVESLANGKDANADCTNTTNKVISGSEIQGKLNADKYTNKLKGISLSYLPKMISKISESGTIIDVNKLPGLINSFTADSYEQLDKIPEELKKSRLFDYFKNYKDEDISSAFSKYLLAGNKLKTCFMAVFEQVFVPDYETVKCYFSQVPATDWSLSVVRAAMNMKHSYSIEDINLMRSICEIVSERQSRIAALQRGGLGRVYWVCVCGNKVDEDGTCQKCSRERNGIDIMTNRALDVLVAKYESVIEAYTLLSQE